MQGTGGFPVQGRGHLPRYKAGEIYLGTRQGKSISVQGRINLSRYKAGEIYLGTR